MPASTLTRPLGRDGPRIPALGLGLMGLSSKVNPPTRDHTRTKERLMNVLTAQPFTGPSRQMKSASPS